MKGVEDGYEVFVHIDAVYVGFFYMGVIGLKSMV